jgi:hypothetical protein
MSLINDDGAVLGKRRPTMHGVDRQQRVIGDHKVRGAGHVSRALDKAFRTIRTALRTQTFANWNGDLGPRSFVVGRCIITVGQSALLGLARSPSAQRQNLGPESGLGCALRGGSQGVDQLTPGNERLLIISGAFSYSQHADVVGTTFEDCVGWPLAGNRLSCINCPGNVVVGQLGLQSQRCGSDDDALAWMPNQPQQRGSQVA